MISLFSLGAQRHVILHDSTRLGGTTRASFGLRPFSAKGVWEPTCVSTAAAILNAINNAVGVRITSLPAAAEKVFAATHPFYTLATHLTCTRLRRLCVRLGPASW